MSKCDKCKYPYDIKKWPCEDCLQGDRFEPKPPTNADRIRAMTDEELAVIVCCQNNKTGDECINERSCYGCTLEWLKQEAEEGE